MSVGGSTGAAAPAEIGLAADRRYLPELESLRGIAILLVTTYHVHGLVRPGVTSEASLLSSFVRAGHAGVVLFFVLSAFLLSLPFLAEADGGRPVDLRRYAARRALRILPAYWLAVVVATVLTATAPRDLARGIPFLFFLNAFRPQDPMYPYGATWWSLATEVHFYLLLPLLPYVARRRWTALVVLAGCLLLHAVLATDTITAGSIPGQIVLKTSILFRAPEFAVGILCAALWRRRGDALRARFAANPWLRNGGADLLLGAVVLLLAVHLRQVTWWGVSGDLLRYRAANAATGVIFGMLLLVILLLPLRTERLFCNPMLDRVGVVSYSVYLIHVPFMWYALGIPWPGVKPGSCAVLVIAGALEVMCIACAGITYRLVEKPFLVRKSRIAVTD